MKTKHLFSWTLLSFAVASLSGCGSDGNAIKYATRPVLSEDGKSLTYGLYPKSNVGSSSLISSLNRFAKKEANGWYLYEGEYYAKTVAYPYDTSYRFDDGSTIIRGVAYWFKCEPIQWNILSSNGNERYLLSSVLLDAHCFFKQYYLKRIIDGKTIYPNNYEYSDIRTWLNEVFFGSAFALDASYIQTVTVDNSAATTDSDTNPYVCNDTHDKVFLPSYQDYVNPNNGRSAPDESDEARRCETTDWAKARGAECSQYYPLRRYWTRTPASNKSDVAWFVDAVSGRLAGVNLTVDLDYLGVRPAISVKIA